MSFWGPPSSAPSFFTALPFSPFSKTAPIGRAAEISTIGQKATKYTSQQAGQTWKERNAAIGSNAFGAIDIQDEEDFRVVDSSRPVQRPSKFNAKKPFIVRTLKGAAAATTSGWTKGAKQNQAGNKTRGGRNTFRINWGSNANRTPLKPKDWSIAVKPEWKLHTSITFQQMTKLNFEPTFVADLMSAGQLGFYDKNIDRVSTKTERKLDRAVLPEGDFQLKFGPTASEDSRMASVVSKVAAENPEKQIVISTIEVLAQLMCASRSVVSWDIIINKQGNKLYLDKRPESEIDFSLALETYQADQDLLAESFENMKEATECGVLWKYNAMSKPAADGKLKDGEIAEAEQDQSIGYVYKEWDFGDDTLLVLRNEIDGYLKDTDGSNKPILVKCLNEFDPRLTDWRGKLDQSKGGAMANEIKNNANKLAKWTAQAMLAGADGIKMGFIARKIQKDRSNHVILSTNYYKTNQFASSMNLNMNNCWGVVKALTSVFFQLPDGKHVLVRDPLKNQLLLYNTN